MSASPLDAVDQLESEAEWPFQSELMAKLVNSASF